MAAQTAMEEAVYEVLLQQEFQWYRVKGNDSGGPGRRDAGGRDGGTTGGAICELEQESDAELGWGLLGDAYDRCGEVCAEYA
ncbi:hypothetical protein ZWY2020_057501 [Hordeum vulgare]|nr:hypothetical protein ZWY2020_057501 [Hordeum vulgare]